MRSRNKAVYQAQPDTAAEQLMLRRDRILSLWVTRVRQSIRAAEAEREPIIIDTIPAFLENLAQALDERFPRSLATEGTTVASEHGGERARVSQFPPGEIVKELQLLRDTVLEVLSEERPIEGKAVNTVVRSVDQAMNESLTAYFLVHQGLREQFVAMLSHDIRNPLSAIKACAFLLMNRTKDSPQASILIKRIAENTQRIDQMLQDLLDASRAQFGERIFFKVARGDLNAMLRETLAHLSTVYGDRFVFEGTPTEGYWNLEAFRRAVENLISNAVKYGDPKKPIGIRLEEVRGRAIVSVRNEGSYIPAEEQENLFRSFMRTRAAQVGSKKGWGLGLAMARGMAEGHGGSITVDSSPERGTTFIIDVPLDARPFVRNPTTPGT